MKKEMSFLNKRNRIFLFLPLAAVALCYLIGATEISYIFNVPMAMSPMRAGMSVNMGYAGQTAGKPLPSFLKTVRQHSNRLNLQSCVTCVECQNLPAAYRPVSFYYGGIIETISSKVKSYVKHFSYDIPHPPQNSFI